mmetsp:Transcript_5376/g.8800  ORF Transcript_5376/g.8800 Transcript_5376/m.8800 type:complete len:203 (+) Transcript_5376:1551-2159(+)
MSLCVTIQTSVPQLMTTTTLRPFFEMYGTYRAASRRKQWLPTSHTCDRPRKEEAQRRAARRVPLRLSYATRSESMRRRCITSSPQQCLSAPDQQPLCPQEPLLRMHDDLLPEFSSTPHRLVSSMAMEEEEEEVLVVVHMAVCKSLLLPAVVVVGRSLQVLWAGEGYGILLLLDLLVPVPVDQSPLTAMTRQTDQKLLRAMAR